MTTRLTLLLSLLLGLLLGLLLSACSDHLSPDSDGGPPDQGQAGEQLPAHDLEFKELAPPQRDQGFPGFDADLGPGAECLPGQRRWCDDPQYSGWSWASCDETGHWETRIDHQGQAVLDCQSTADGRRPNTVIACYFHYFNPVACERPDCVLPPGEEGKLCPPSPGQLCDYCMPINPECVEAGANCVVTNSMEAFCGRACTAASDCPESFSCVTYQRQGGSTSQCIPDDLSCVF